MLVDFLSGTIPGVNISACKAGDNRCEDMVDFTTTTLNPKTFQVEVPYQFDGYLRITSVDHITTDYPFGGPLVGSPSGAKDEDGTPLVVGEPIGIPTFKQLDDFLTGKSVGYIQDKTKGILAARTVDCNFKRAKGVTIDITPEPEQAFPYTLLSNSPVFVSPSQPLLPTDERGVLGYVNLEPRNYQITGKLPSGVTMARLQSPQVSASYGPRAVRINANTLTVAEIRTDEGYFVGR